MVCMPRFGDSEYAVDGFVVSATELIVSGEPPAFLTVSVAAELATVTGTPPKFMLGGWTSIKNIGEVPEPENVIVWLPESSDSWTAHDDVPATTGLNVP